MDEVQQIQVRPVRNRAQKPMKLPGGFTVGEMILVLLTFFLTAMLGIGGMVRIAILGGIIAYIKLLKDQLPDNYVQQAIRFYLRKHFLFRAGGRDSAWVPPIIRGKR